MIYLIQRCYFCKDERTCGSKGQDGPGVEDTDFVLYVTTKSTGDCDVGDTIAHASHCQQEAALDR